MKPYALNAGAFAHAGVGVGVITDDSAALLSHLPTRVWVLGIKMKRERGSIWIRALTE